MVTPLVKLSEFLQHPMAGLENRVARKNSHKQSGDSIRDRTVSPNVRQVGGFNPSEKY